MTDLEIKKLLTEKQVSEKKHLGLNVKIFNVQLCIKYKQSPLAYTLVGSVSSLDPFQICNDQERYIGKFRRALNILHSCNRVDIKMSVMEYIVTIQHLFKRQNICQNYKEFRKSEDRVDRLFLTAYLELRNTPNYEM